MTTDRLSPATIALRLFVLSMPLLLNDFYLLLMPKDADTLGLVLDVIIYVGWQCSIIYLARQAGWFTGADLGITARDAARQVMAGLAILAAAYIVNLGITAAALAVEQHCAVTIWSKWHYPVPAGWSLPLAGVYVLYLSITAGVIEEIIYRGIVIAQLRRITENRLVLVVGSALLFTAIHWSLGPRTWAEAFIFGAFWAWLFIRQGRLVPIMIAHTLYDVLTILGTHEMLVKWLGRL